MSLKTLRPYQADLIDDVLWKPGHVLVQAPTGSGKTLQIVALSHLLSDRYDRILIAAPQQQIEEGFTNESGAVKYPYDARVIPLPDIKASRESSLRSRQYLKSFLASPIGCATACTHQALAFPGAADLLPEDCRRILLVIDEAHHAPAEGLGSFIEDFERRGGHLHFYSATPWRQDGQRVMRPEMRLVRWGLPQHMAEGFAPRHLIHQMRVLGKPGEASTAAEFRGEKVAAGYELQLVRALVEQFLEDRQPKTIIRVPPVSGGSGPLVGKIVEAFEAHGLRVLDATGVGGKKQAAFLEALREEKHRSYENSRFDVVVGIQRVLEGTDWKHCSAVYCLGMPGGLATVGQLLGRALRQKGEDCPEVHRETARIVFFVPGSGTLQKLGLQHSRNALLTSVFLADFEVGQEWATSQGIDAGISAAFGPDRRMRAALRSRLTMDEETKAEAMTLLVAARQHLNAVGMATATLEDLVQAATALAAETGSAISERSIERAAVLLAAARPGGSGKKLRDAARRVAEVRSADWAKATTVKEAPQLGTLLDSIFSELREEFRDETLEGSAVLEAVGTQLHKLTGGQMMAFMERLRNAYPRVITHAMVLGWLDKYFRAANGTRQLPKLSTNVPGTDGFRAGLPLRWEGVEKALLRGEHGLPGNECLAELVHKHLGFTAGYENALSPSKVHVTDGPTPILLEHHIRRTGTFPRPVEDAIPYTDLTWATLHKTVLRFRESMGLELPPGREDLAFQYFYLYQNLLEILANWVAMDGSVPTMHSGVIPNAGGLTWSDADAFVKRRNLGYLRRSTSYSDGLKWPESTLVELSESESLLTFWVQVNIYKWCNRWVRSTGMAPVTESGDIPDSGGVTWAEVDGILRRFHRMAFPSGLPRAVQMSPTKDMYPYAYSSLEDRIAHFQVVQRARGVSTDGDFGPAA